MLFTRILTSLFLIPVAAFIIYMGGFLLAVAALICYALVNYEYFANICKLHPLLRNPQLIIHMFIPFSYLAFGWQGFAIFTILGLIVWLSAIIVIVEYEKHQLLYKEYIPASALGFVYVGLLGSQLVLLASKENANLIVAWLLIITILVDTFAYAGGRLIGGSRLAPRISPNKTVSGALVGFMAAIIGGIPLGLKLLPNLNPAYVIVITLVAGLLVQIGDLTESLIKRIFSVKDSGAILPGHGGLLDRIDGLLFIAPLGLLIHALLP